MMIFVHPPASPHSYNPTEDVLTFTETLKKLMRSWR